MATTAHSEYHKLDLVYLKSITVGFVDQSHIDSQWESLNFLDRPDMGKALVEYQEFENIFNRENIGVGHFLKDDTVGMDSIYCRDASIVTDYGVIICNMGKDGRMTEPAAQKAIYEKNGIPILGTIQAPGTLEGGDVAWLDSKTLAVAHGYRTNQSGFDQLKALLSPHGINVMQVPLPHYKGPSDVFHLMSILSPVDKDLAVVYSPLMPVMFRQLLIDRGYELVEVPDEEFESMGCNVLAVSPRSCVMVAGNPITKSRLEAAGCKVHEYSGNHISVFGGGGPTCLTRPVRRVID